MKNLNLLLPAMMIFMASCIHSETKTLQETTSDSALTKIESTSKALKQDSLQGVLSIKSVVKSGEPVSLTFTINNTADSTQTFCKWHTPFEPLISKYLDVTDIENMEAAYKGPMAKRIMPPPADSYLKIKAGESITVTVDLLKGYDLKAGKIYTIRYNSNAISGISVEQPVTFKYEQ